MPNFNNSTEGKKGKKRKQRNKCRRADRVAQVVQHLPSKCEALSSKPQYHTQKKKKERKKEMKEIKNTAFGKREYIFICLCNSVCALAPVGIYVST
jgi:hypothetical protein